MVVGYIPINIMNHQWIPDDSGKAKLPGVRGGSELESQGGGGQTPGYLRDVGGY